MSDDKIAVISPLGSETIDGRAGAARLDTLNGKTIGEMWNGDFKGNFTFPAIRKALLERYPEVTFVPFETFPYSTIRGTAAHQREVDAHMLALAQQHGVDAVISGNGG